MQKTVLKYVKGLSADANSWERRNHKRYGSLSNIRRQIEYDMKHGVTRDEIFAFLSRINHHSSFRVLRLDAPSMGRLSEIEEHFTTPKVSIPAW
jgi:hypothetical protein